MDLRRYFFNHFVPIMLKITNFESPPPCGKKKLCKSGTIPYYHTRTHTLTKQNGGSMLICTPKNFQFSDVKCKMATNKYHMRLHIQDCLEG